MAARVMTIGILVLLTSACLAAGDAHSGPGLVKDPHSLKGKVELKVEDSLSEDGPWLLF